MRSIHFFKAKSRIGLQNAPIGQSELNIGVEDGPDVILTAEFLDLFGNPAIDEFEFSKPEDISPEKFLSVLGNEMTALKKKIAESLKQNEMQIVLGGDHSVTFASVSALLERVDDPADIGYIQIDSHGDMNLYSESPTKNFHGMYLRALTDNFDKEEIAKLVDRKLATENMWYIGNLDLDEGEREFMENEYIKTTSVDQLRENRERFAEQVKIFADKYKHLHLSIDIDGFDQSVAPSTGIPAQNGLLFDDVEPVLDTVSLHPNLSLDLVEVNPRRSGADKTVYLAQKILLKSLK